MPTALTSNSEELTLSNRGYKLLKQLGEGSYAKVFLAEYAYNKADSSNVKVLACKIIDTSKAPRDFVKKFLPRELDILVKINHPHIIHVHSIFQRKAKYYVFMRYGENGDLLEFVLKRGAISEAQARVWLRQMALGIQYLHDMDIAHRDLKCENILITNNYNVKLADFGFARFVTDSTGKRISSETYCGSLSYAAPEILKGNPYHPRIADIWSLGIILYVMLNKAMPFDDTNIKRLYEQQSNRRWKFRAKVADILSDQVKKLMTHILEPDVAKRYRIEQVLSSEWMAMDPRLAQLNPAEQAAMVEAQQGKRKHLEGSAKPTTRRVTNEDMTIFKEGKEDEKEEKQMNNHSTPSLLA
ncbi:hypothetical protein HHI36_011401 [Cryptolaemus montrouzieri]|uniref:Protein kinase domain-containing protein n=1 Tax=Cryptolaemus montrouzieri TaxID=559131 RepID=A0ABD2MLN4_9CUCU